MLPSKSEIMDNNKSRYIEPQECCYSGNELILEDTRRFREKEYFIPFGRISGINSLAYSQEEYREHRDDTVKRTIQMEKNKGIPSTLLTLIANACAYNLDSFPSL